MCHTRGVSGGKTLVVEAPEDMQLSVVDTMGRTIRLLHVYEGINRYTGIEPGIYIVGRQKVLITR